MSAAHRGDRLDAVEIMRKRLNPLRPQRCEFAPASGEQL